MASISPSAIELTEVEQSILDGVRKIAEHLYPDQPIRCVWTKQLTERLCDLGYARGFITRAKAPGRYEWLFDVSWVRCEENNWHEFRGLELASEIEWEWTEDELLWDFHKLIVCDACYRVFIFSQKEDYESQFALLRKAAEFTSGKRFLAIGLPEQTQSDHTGIQFRAWLT